MNIKGLSTTGKIVVVIMIILLIVVFINLGIQSSKKKQEAVTISAIQNAANITASIGASLQLLEDDQFNELLKAAGKETKSKAKADRVNDLINYVISKAENNQAYLDELYGARNRVYIILKDLK